MILRKISDISVAVAIFLCGLVVSVTGQFNLYMNKSETMRLLGIPEEVYYVRDGNVNDYSLSFNPSIKSGMIDIFFNWQALRHSPSHRPSRLHYSLTVAVSNTLAISQPSINIPREGIMPRCISVIRIRLACTGHVRAEVDVKITLNVTQSSSSNNTYLVIRRKKVCLKGLSEVRDGESHSANEVECNEDEDGKEEEEDDEEAVSQADVRIPAGDVFAFGTSHMFYIGVGSTCATIIIVTCAVLVYYLYARKQRNANESLSYSTSTVLMSHDRTQLKADTSSRSTISGTALSLKQGAPTVAVHDLSASEVQASLQEIAVDIGQLSLAGILFEGDFGRMCLGTLQNQASDQLPALTVIVKTVTDEASFDEECLLMRCGCLTKGLRHPNIISILAVSFSSNLHPHLIYPFSNEENLKIYLHHSSISNPEFARALSTRELVYIAMQIAVGLRYLHKRQIIHRDIATRNCVIDRLMNVKVTDGALAPCQFPHDYHCVGDKERRPVKWLSLEALVDRKYTPSSDTWAFGVTMWELVTLGQQPFSEIDPVQMATCLTAGVRMGQPVNCPNKIFSLMAWCWSLCPTDRPRLAQLVAALEQFYSGLGQFV